jgi:hypothetical protein
MGLSMVAVDAAIRPLVASAKPVISEALNRRFVVEERHDGFYQREMEASPTDKPPFDNAHKLAYVIGSGVNGFSYLVRRGNHLVQAPVSFYRREEITWSKPRSLSIGARTLGTCRQDMNLRSGAKTTVSIGRFTQLACNVTRADHCQSAKARGITLIRPSRNWR